MKEINLETDGRVQPRKERAKVYTHVKERASSVSSGMPKILMEICQQDSRRLSSSSPQDGDQHGR